MDNNEQRVNRAARKIAQQAVEIYEQRKHASRWKTHFYKVVIGGNVDTVKSVVEYMSDNGMTDTLDWLLMKEGSYSDRTVRKSTTKNPGQLFCTRVIMFFILAIVNIILTPVFYAVHIISTSLLNRTQRRISVKSNLPLALAVFSQSADMIKYFLSIGVDIEQVDTEGNNVFHYVADLSSTSPTKAVDILDTMLCIFVEQIRLDIIKKMLMEDRNSAGLTVLEYSVKYGSLSFTSHLLNLPTVLQESEIAVGRDHVSFAGDDDSRFVDADTRVELVDVTKYEAGSLPDQSTLLNLLSDTDILSMTPNDLQLFTNLSFIADWINMKTKQMLPGVIFVQVIDVLLTIMMLYITIGTKLLSVRVDRIINYETSQVTELIALAQNTSHIFKPDRFHEVLQTMPYHKELSEFTQDVVTQYPYLLQQDVTAANTHHILERFQMVFDSLTSSKEFHDPAWQHISRNGFKEFSRAVCIPALEFSTTDLLPFLVPYPPERLYSDSCSLKALIDVVSHTCAADGVAPDYVYETFISAEDSDDTFYASILFFIVVLCSGFYILLDLLERVVFIYTCVVHQANAKTMFMTAWSRKVPGSYARKQINVCSHIGIVMSAIIPLTLQLPSATNQYSDLEKFVFIITLTLRFVMHIHTMRLLPGIGHFIISIFMMGINFAHFSIVFGIVVLIFSGIFHVVADSATCPLLKVEGFQDLPKSMFATFQLAFGHGEFDAYSSSTAMSLSYVLYVVIVGLLLMNLIIAVMSSTASQIMIEPWKAALWQIEWLDEATSVEYTFSVLGLMCRCCCSCGYVSHRNAGFVVKKVDGKTRIYIEKFYCPAMDSQEAQDVESTYF